MPTRTFTKHWNMNTGTVTTSIIGTTANLSCWRKLILTCTNMRDFVIVIRITRTSITGTSIKAHGENEAALAEASWILDCSFQKEYKGSRDETNGATERVQSG